MTKLIDNDFINLINLLKEIKDEIFIKKEDKDKKQVELINSFKDSPELLLKLLKETDKPYKNIKDIKTLLKGKGFDKQIKDSTIKFLLENIDFN